MSESSRPGLWRAVAWLGSTAAALRFIDREVKHEFASWYFTEAYREAAWESEWQRNCATLNCLNPVTTPRGRWCNQCRQARDAASKRRSKRRRKQQAEVIVMDCCSAHEIERQRLFDKYGRDVAIKRWPYLKNARCIQCAQWAEANVKQAAPCVVLADEAWFAMGFLIDKGGSTGVPLED